MTEPFNSPIGPGVVVVIILSFLIYISLVYFWTFILEWIGGCVGLFLFRKHKTVKKFVLILWMVPLPTLFSIILAWFVWSQGFHYLPDLFWKIVYAYYLFLIGSLVINYLAGFLRKRTVKIDLKNRYAEHTIDTFLAMLLTTVLIPVLIYLYFYMNH